ncbi:CBS domain-containing protein [Rhizobium bangladeshense]|uniref:CBS domain-containing protein n=1 Tax=Rhizobium bangladeshense TaxID=1138189 RepID=UPI001C8397FD|nr:CBS domain-containing protein [Rhizobium bangladeshense]MBX4898502.1 CBS domain-containing protein [Rhizobium bangladeshense]MBX4902893.1 CBS domain-containing protein [Rhizobium bangladeshense]MBX4914645.1 CBS domain-containing protein [Rhizobium bangladeshense]MBY3616526.1 CBS domain-containing protein [Rhizobium bangladeshense]
MLQIRSIMTPNPTTIGPNVKIWEAANAMVDRHISGLPVVDQSGDLLGIISESDFLRRGEIHTQAPHSLWRDFFASRGGLAEEYAKSFGNDVGEVMSSPAVTVQPDASIETAAKLMAEKNVKRLPVVEGNHLIGIVTRFDVMAALVRELTRHCAARTDSDIQSALEAELARQKWGDSVTLHVADGVVTLEGRVLDSREKTALHVAAENTIGVKRVDDRVQVVAPPDMPVPPPGFYL